MTKREKDELRRTGDELKVRVYRLFLKTQGRGAAWECLERLVSELEPIERRA